MRERFTEEASDNSKLDRHPPKSSDYLQARLVYNAENFETREKSVGLVVF